MTKEKPNITLNFYGSVGQQIANVENQTVYVGKDGNIQIANVENSTSPAPSPSPSEPYLAQSPSIDQYLTVAYRDKRKNDYENMLSIIRQSSWSDKDHARFALAIYNANILVPRTKPHTFSEWYQLFCNMFGLTYHKDYEPGKLTPNDATRQIELYL